MFGVEHAARQLEERIRAKTHLLGSGTYQNLLLRVGLEESNVSHAGRVAKFSVQKDSSNS